MVERAMDNAAGEGEWHDAARPDARERLTATTQVMRFGGALLLTAAASSFMLQHWQGGSSATRYLYLLLHTLLLAVSGATCGLRVRESRAARTFFAIVLASLPVHFAVLGGMLRSVLPLDSARGASDLWPMHSLPLALGLIGLGLLVLAPLLRLALLALARPCARELTGGTLAMNALLLLPVRSPAVIALLCGAMCGAALWFDARARHAGYGARTPAARYARALLAAPIAIAAARAALFYDPTLFAYGAFATCAGVALFFAAPRVLSQPAGDALQPIAALIAAFGAACMSCAPDAGALAAGATVPLRVLPACALLVALSCFAIAAADVYRRAAALIAGVALAANVIGHWDFERCTLAAAVALVVGSATLCGGVHARSRLAFLSGALSAVLGAAQLLIASIELPHLRSWATLSAVGAVLIFAAALLERHGDHLLRAARALNARLASW
jgi:hypothetical protein